MLIQYQVELPSSISKEGSSVKLAAYRLFPFVQISLQHIQIRHQDAMLFRKHIGRIELLVAEAFSASLLCPIPKIKQHFKGQIIQNILVRKVPGTS